MAQCVTTCPGVLQRVSCPPVEGHEISTMSGHVRPERTGELRIHRCPQPKALQLQGDEDRDEDESSGTAIEVIDHSNLRARVGKERLCAFHSGSMRINEWWHGRDHRLEFSWVRGERSSQLRIFTCEPGL